MEKKAYIYPLTCVEVLDTEKVMAITNPTQTPVDPGDTPAPRRRDKPF